MTDRITFCICEINICLPKAISIVFQKKGFKMISLPEVAGFLHNCVILDDDNSYVKFCNSYLQVGNKQYANILKKYLDIRNTNHDASVGEIHAFGKYMDEIVPEYDESRIGEMNQILNGFTDMLISAKHMQMIFKEFE